jgi:predicted DNA-binding mobile mystery protein A
MLSSAKRTARRRLDERLRPVEAATLQPPPKGWLRAIRDSLGMTAVQFGRRQGVTSQSIEDVEKSEAAGTIRLDTLRRTAAALDCTLVYALVPNRSLQETVERQARRKALAAFARVDQTMVLEDQQVANVDREELIAEYIEGHIRDRDLWDD